MRRFLAVLLFLALPVLACAPMTAPQAQPPMTYSAAVPLDATVALVDDQDRAYCAGTWVGPEKILTASHCLIDSDTDQVAVSVHVRTYTGVVFTAPVVKVLRRADLGLLSAPHPHAWAPLADSWAQGEELTIIGHPNREEWTWMRGWVSRGLVHGSPEDPGDMQMLQIQAPIWYGNSGGRAFKSLCQLVGVCSMRASQVPDLGLFVAPGEIVAFLA